MESRHLHAGIFFEKKKDLIPIFAHLNFILAMPKSLNFNSFFQSILKGFSQIMLQENSLTGVLFFIGLLIGSPLFAIGALAAVISGTLTAELLDFDKKEIQAGIYGFSPALVGVALILLFKPVLLIWILILLGGAVAAWLQHIFIRLKFPAYTFPFILVAWGFVFFLWKFTVVPTSGFFAADSPTTLIYVIGGVFKGYGQVIFQGSLFSALLFLIGVGIANPTAALYGLSASLFAVLISFIIGQETGMIVSGLYGFNAVLTAIALSGKTSKDALWVCIGVVLTVVIHILLVVYPILSPVGGVFTFPFVAGTWITLLLKKELENTEKKILGV